MIEELVRRNRSYRRFFENERVGEDTLRQLIELARIGGSAANLQPLRYVLSSDPKLNAEIFSTLAWAGYLKDWPGPEEGERPSAYITMLCDTEINKSAGCDSGIACQNILLGAVEQGLGGCILGSVNRDELRRILSIPEKYEILYVIALGNPKETVVLDTVGVDGDIRYWREADGTHHVPKRSLEQIILPVK